MITRNIATRRPSGVPRPRASTGSRTTQGARVRKGRASRATQRIAKGECNLRPIDLYSLLTAPNDAEVEESAAEDVPARATKRRKISEDVLVDTPPAQPASVPRGTRRRSEPSGRVAVGEDATVQSEPKSRSRTIARRRSVAVCDETTKANKGEEKALQEDKRSLKRDRQAFEQESQRERAELNKRENKVQKLDSQLQSKLAALKEKENGAKKRETECKKREQTLKKREAECAALEADLAEREKELQKKEQEIEDRALGVNINRSDEAIDELDAMWQCALCFDVMACPYSLSPAQCGHTYCAICILKWYFTNLCSTCGDWCKPLDCPLCRTVIPRRLERPRQMCMLPFTPARAADERITQLIGSLCGPVPESPSKSSGSSKRGKGKKKQAAGVGGSDAEPLMPSTGWEYGGSLRAEWQARNSRGRTEMRRLIDLWPEITETALRAYKARICTPA